MAIDPYLVLGLERDCTKKDIRNAYKMAAKENHPDIGGDREKFELIKLCHDILMDTDKRKKFDDYGFADEDPEAKLAIDAIQNLRSMFFQILQSTPADKLEHKDIVYAIKKFIQDKVVELYNNIQQANTQGEQQKKTLKVIEKRLKRKGKQPNFLVDALRESIAALPQQIIALEYQQQIANEMLRVIDDFTYDYEPEPEPPVQPIAQKYVYITPWGNIG